MRARESKTKSQMALKQVTVMAPSIRPAVNQLSAKLLVQRMLIVIIIAALILLLRIAVEAVVITIIMLVRLTVMLATMTRVATQVSRTPVRTLQVMI